MSMQSFTIHPNPQAVCTLAACLLPCTECTHAEPVKIRRWQRLSPTSRQHLPLSPCTECKARRGKGLEVCDLPTFFEKHHTKLARCLTSMAGRPHAYKSHDGPILGVVTAHENQLLSKVLSQQRRGNCSLPMQELMNPSKPVQLWVCSPSETSDIWGVDSRAARSICSF